MMDRTPTKVLPNGAIRYGVYDEAGNFLRYEYIKPEDEPTQEGTPINKATLLKDETATRYGLGENAVPDDLFMLLSQAKNSLLRDLNIMLNLSLGTSNIDAWCDTLDSANYIDTAKSYDYVLSGGSLTKSQTGVVEINVTNNNLTWSFGRNVYGYSLALGQSFVTSRAYSVKTIQLFMKRVSSATDYVSVKIYETSSGLPGTLLYTSNQIQISTISSSDALVSFNFSGARLEANKRYALAVERTNTSDTTDALSIRMNNPSAYTQGSLLENWQGTWRISPMNNSFYFVITSDIPEKAIVCWKPVLSTERFIRMAISAEQSLGSGTITYYVSNDGVAWVQISTLNAAQLVSFSTKSVYLKVQITGNVSLSGIAWGGY